MPPVRTLFFRPKGVQKMDIVSVNMNLAASAELISTLRNSLPVNHELTSQAVSILDELQDRLDKVWQECNDFAKPPR